ncbi:hypothetical protein M501DRAFT_1031826 [Patellaria atrata CBS 101060]|uniref:Apple domain-containing protein n=1 Tax=Patellaria atrata CBS 101060 TaxID=1346257 RepID=A0A9P4VPF7_9PEZI|nr:hypothetical protein M501DRAFT_1031826 [Patellaria atrata CBS 101060]
MAWMGRRFNASRKAKVISNPKRRYRFKVEHAYPWGPIRADLTEIYMLYTLDTEFTLWFVSLLGLYQRCSALAIRQSSGSACGLNSTFESYVGQRFTTFCETDADTFNIGEPIPGIESLEICADKCSDSFYPCYGAVYSPLTKNCWQKTGPITQPYFSFNDDRQVAVADPAQLELSGDNFACGLDDGSIFTTDDGMKFEIKCGFDLPGNSLCPSNSAACESHAQTLEECMDYCANSQPLCVGAVWGDPQEYAVGFSNCFLKNDTSSRVVSRPGMFHFAKAVLDIPDDGNCEDGDTYTTSGNNAVKFELKCDTKAANADVIDAIHKDNRGDCFDACAASDDDCMSAMFDSTLESGFKNCYLLSSSGRRSNAPGYVFASISQRSRQNPNGTSSSDSDSSTPSSGASADSQTNSADSNTNLSSSSSKAWIAGPVIGVIVVLVALAGVIFWRRRRKAREAELLAHQAPPIEIKPQPYYGGPPVYAHEVAGTPPVPYEMPGNNSWIPQELPSQPLPK